MDHNGKRSAIMGQRMYFGGSRLSKELMTHYGELFKKYVCDVCDRLVILYGWPEAIGHGDAPGYDRLFGGWAKHAGYKLGENLLTYPAKWSRYGNGAGPKRNKEGLELFKPTLVIAAPGGNGTDNMITTAKAKGIKVIELPTPAELGYSINFNMDVQKALSM